MGFKIGSIEIKYYALMILAGFIASFVVSYLKIIKIKRVKADILFTVAIISLFTSIIGARIWSVAFDGGDNVKSFANFFGFDDNGKFVGIAGLSVQGGVLLAVLCSVSFALWSLGKPKNFSELESKQLVRVSLWVYADAVIPSILLGQAIGRWGNFFNHELYGGVVKNLDWLKALMPGVWKHMHIDSSGLWDPTLNPANLRAPMFLYEAFFNFIGFLVIFVGMEFIKKLRNGTFTSMYFIWYGLVRAIQEPFKHPPGEDTYNMAPYLAWSIVFVIFGVALFVWAQFLNTNSLRETKVFFKMRVIFTYWFTVNIVEKISKKKRLVNATKNKDFFYRAFKPDFTKKGMYHANR